MLRNRSLHLITPNLHRANYNRLECDLPSVRENKCEVKDEERQGTHQMFVWACREKHGDMTNESIRVVNIGAGRYPCCNTE